MRLRPGFRPGPWWGSIQRSPDPLAGFKGADSRRGGGAGMEGTAGGEEGKGKGGEEQGGTPREGKGRGG